MTEFVFIIVIVFGILQIILFFKIWGMTNNVKEMRDYFLKEKDAKEKAQNEKYFFNIGEQVVCEGRIYEVVDNLPQEMCKCRDVKTGTLCSLKSSELRAY